MLEKGYRWLSIIRISSATAILGTAAYYYRFLGTDFVIRTTILILFIYIITFVLGYYIRASKPRAVFSYLLFALDITIYTAVIFFTGALESSFLFLYAIAIIAAAVVLSSRGAFFAAFYSTLMLIFMAILIYKEVLPPNDIFDSAITEHVELQPLLFKAFLQSLFLFFIAALSSYFAEAVKSKSIELGRLRESLTRARMDTSFILQNIPSAVFVLDNSGNVLYINDAARKIFSGNGNNGKIKNISEIEKIWPEIYNIFLKSAAEDPDQSYQTFEKEISHRDRYFFVVFSRLPGPQRFIFTIQDVTEQKKLQEKLREQEKYALLGHQMAEMVHSLGNPLAALKGVAQILKNGVQKNDMDKLISILTEEIDRISSILHQYRQFSSSVGVSISPHDVKEFFDSIIRKISCMTGTRKVKITLKMESPPPIAHFDLEKMEEAIMNLVRNSLDALGEGGEITIGVVGAGAEIRGWRKKWHVPHGHWGIFVKDNAGGIDERIVSKIFTPSFTTKAQGLGLGLAITKRIVESHNSTIDFDTLQGEGTIFVLILPVSPPDSSGKEAENG